jgi:hypothetical protein
MWWIVLVAVVAAGGWWLWKKYGKTDDYTGDQY